MVICFCQVLARASVSGTSGEKNRLKPMIIASSHATWLPAQKASAKSKVNSASTRSAAISREGSLTRGAISRLPRKRATRPAPSKMPMVSGVSPLPASQTLQKGRKIP